MIFTSIEFVLFFAVVFVCYWVSRSNCVRKIVLLIASYYFYACWDVRFLALIMYVSLVAYVASVIVARGGFLSITPKRAVAGAITSHLLVLGVFKYFGFFRHSAIALASAWGIHLDWPVVHIILPVGISFYVFQAISYNVDTYRGVLRNHRSLFDVALYIAFFPQLVAGPIVRASGFFPQLETARNWSRKRFVSGLHCFLVGFIYKSVFSDNLAPFVDVVYADVDAFSAHALRLAVISFYGQIYFDFAGYSLMAIGVARALGYYIPRNFNYPYAARSIADFWRRWHMSLSSWLRDYLYIPLGGNRLSPAKTSRNLMLTMLLGGLWHGAAANFMVWGGLHGVALIARKLLHPVVASLPRVVIGMIGLLSTQLLVMMLWIPFRAESWADTATVVFRVFGVGGAVGGRELPASLLILFAALVLDHVIGTMRRKRNIRLGVPAAAFYFGLGMLIALTLPLVSLQVNPFIYFQF